MINRKITGAVNSRMPLRMLGIFNCFSIKIKYTIFEKKSTDQGFNFSLFCVIY